MRPRALVLAFVAAAIVPLLVGGSAMAHSQWVSSSPFPCTVLPSAPTEVTITVSEAVQSGTGSIRVTNATGARFDVPPVTASADGRTLSVALAPSGPGTYNVTWSAVSAVDGHFTRSIFLYGVQDSNGNFPGTLPCSGPTPSGAPVSPVEVGFRALGFLGLGATLGIAVLANFMWLPAGRDPDARASRAYGLGLPVLLNAGRIAAFAFGASMAGLLVLSTGLEGTTAAEGLVRSPYIQSVAARIGVAVALFVLMSRAFVLSRSETSGPEGVARPVQASLVLVLVAIVAGSLSTHAAAAPILAAVGVVADAAHVAGVGLWVGGLVGIVSVRRLLREPDAVALARIVLGRFSRLAAYAVGLVLAGGATLALLLVGSWDGLVGTGYGWVVLGKIALFAPMLAFGAFNRYRLIPKTAEDAPIDAVRRLVRNVRFETGLGIAVFVLAGLLTSMTPAVSVAAGPQEFALDAPAGDLRVHLWVDPYPSAPGMYTFTTTLFNATTGAPFDAEAHNTTGRVTLTLLNSTLPPTTTNLSGPHYPNHFFELVTLSRVGFWRADVTFSRSDAADVRATFYVTIQAGG